VHRDPERPESVVRPALRGYYYFRAGLAQFFQNGNKRLTASEQSAENTIRGENNVHFVV